MKKHQKQNLFQNNDSLKLSFFETKNGDRNNTLFKEVESYVCTHEACSFLKISKGSLNNMIYRGELQRYKLGRRNRFKISDLQGLIK